MPPKDSHIAFTRWQVRTALHRRQLPADLVYDAELIMAELATNALKHTVTPEIYCALQLQRQAIRVSVTDHGAAQAPALTTPVPAAQWPPATGWGLHVVEALATQWGTQSVGRGRRYTWAELHHHCPGTP
ncbi:ATP-binding protein [Streptomyces harbinensis]|nr:ATP-binding protein [Streptomyces harbinensis]